MSLIALALYVIACAVCGIMGRNTTIGFLGHFLLAFILTPLIDFIAQAVGRQSAQVRDELKASRSQ
jgi:hypothetical protein